MTVESKSVAVNSKAVSTILASPPEAWHFSLILNLSVLLAGAAHIDMSDVGNSGQMGRKLEYPKYIPCTVH